MRAWRGDRVIAVAAAVVLPLVVCAAGAVPDELQWLIGVRFWF